MFTFNIIGTEGS